MTREKSNLFNILQFKQIIVNKRYSALCLVCQKELKNTSESRLKSHRRICKVTAAGNSIEITAAINSPMLLSSASESENFLSVIETSSNCNDNDARSTVIELNSIPDQEDIVVEDEYGNSTVIPIEVILPGFSVRNDSIECNNNSDLNDIFKSNSCTSSHSISNPFKHSQLQLQNRVNQIHNCTISNCQNGVASYFDSSSTPSSSNLSCMETESTSTSKRNLSSSLDVASISTREPKRSSINPVKKKKKSKSFQTSMNQYVAVLTEDDTKKITEKICDFFYGCNVPFSTVESSHFVELIYMLNPAYGAKMQEFVTRKSLADHHLDEAYNRYLQKNIAFDNQDAVILVDGWTNKNSNTKNLVTLLHNANGDRAFVDSSNFSGISEDTEHILQTVNKSIKIAKDLYNANVFAIASDSAAVMMCMGRKTDLWHTPCNSHLANLLAKNIVQYSSDVTKDVKDVLNAFSGPDLEHKIIQLGGTKMRLPIDIRWSAYRDSDICCKQNLKFMKQLICTDDGGKIAEKIKHLIISDEFVNRIDEQLALLNPISKIINKCQELKSSVSDAAHLWLELKIPEYITASLKEDYELRKNQALTKYALTAYILDPRYYKEVNETFYKADDVQNKSYHVIIENFLVKSLTEEGISSYHKYIENKGIFYSLLEKNVTHPLTFWKAVSANHPELSRFARKLHSLPASTAALEGLFNQWSYVHNRVRNCLNYNRSKKLMFVYHTLKLIDKNKIDDY